MPVDRRQGVRQVAQVHLGQEAQPAVVDAEHRGAGQVGEPHRPQHRPVAAQGHEQRGPAGQLFGGYRDGGAVDPADLLDQPEHRELVARGPVEQGRDRLLRRPGRVQHHTDRLQHAHGRHPRRGLPGVGVDWSPVSRREDEVSRVTEQDPGTSYDDEPAEDDGVLDPSDSLETDDLGADVLDTGVDAGEGYRGATRFGTTLDEERRGESLDQLLAEEEPDVTPTTSGPTRTTRATTTARPSRGPAAWWRPTKAPTATRRRTRWPPTSASTVAGPQPRRLPCT